MSVSPAPDPDLPKWAAEPADYSSPPNSASLEKDEGNVGDDEKVGTYSLTYLDHDHMYSH